MRIFDTYGEILLQQQEGNRQIASALLAHARASRLFGKLLATLRRHAPGEQFLR